MDYVYVFWGLLAMNKLNLMAPINSLGYGIVGLNFLNELNKAGVEVSLFPIGGLKSVEAAPIYHEMIKKCIKNAELFDNKAPCLRIFHQFSMAERIGSGKFYGMPIFELDKFTDIEKHHLFNLDTCLVNSEWARSVVNNNLRELNRISISNLKVNVIPLGVDTEIFKPNPTNFSSATTFLNIGKWEVRKGHDILKTAFETAFTPDDNVQLWMCCTNPFFSKEKNTEWENFYLSSKLGSKIKIIPRRETQYDVANLMNQADCGVFPSRGEGWNLEALELMACGKHIITTNYSGHTEFCNKNNCFGLIDIEELEPAYDGIWFNKQGDWAKIRQVEIDKLVNYMRAFHTKKLSLGKEFLLNEEGISTSKEYTWKNATQKLISLIC